MIASFSVWFPWPQCLQSCWGLPGWHLLCLWKLVWLWSSVDYFWHIIKLFLHCSTSMLKTLNTIRLQVSVHYIIYHQNFFGLKKMKMCHLCMILCISILCWMHLGNAFASVDWDHEWSISHLVPWTPGSLKMVLLLSAGLCWPCVSNRLAPGSFTKCQAGFQEGKFFSKRIFFITFIIVPLARATKVVKPRVICGRKLHGDEDVRRHALGRSTRECTTADAHHSHAILGQRH